MRLFLFKFVLFLVPALVGASLVGYAGYTHLAKDFEDNITVINSDELAALIPENSVKVVVPEEETPIEEFKEEVIPKESITIALVGSDTRVGQGTGFGKAGGARSDTTILIKMNAERTHAVFMSIPRDLRVEIPACEKSNGSKLVPQIAKFNAAYAYAGPNCMLETLKHNFDIEVNHIAIVNFLGFQKIVDIIGGVEICLPKPVYDKDANLDLEAGRQTLYGEDALAFVRARKGIGDGSDISRTERQRVFLSSVLQKAENTNIIFNPLKLYNILMAISESLTTNQELANVDKMVELAIDAGRIGSENFQSVPVSWSSNGDGTISFDEEGMSIIQQFNKGEFPIVKDSDETESKLPSDGVNSSEVAKPKVAQYERVGFSANLDICNTLG